MAQLEFDEATNQLMEQFNASPGATRRRERLLELLALRPGEFALDIGSGPGHYASAMSVAVGESGRITGIDSAADSLEVARRRCSDQSNVDFVLADAVELPLPDDSFDAVLSTQTFEYLPDIDGALAAAYRVLKPGGRILIHDTEWDGLVWHTHDRTRMARIMTAWDKHLADPNLPQTLASKLTAAGFRNVAVEPLVHVEITYDEASLSAILIKFIVGYVSPQHVSTSEVSAWESELRELGSTGDYFFSTSEYVFTAFKP